MIEDAVTSSGLPYTLLRPQSFMQNTLMTASTVATQEAGVPSRSEGWQVGNDRRPRHWRSCRQSSHRRGP